MQVKKAYGGGVVWGYSSAYSLPCPQSPQCNTKLYNAMSYKLSTCIRIASRSQWLRGLRRGSAAARLLGWRVPIPPGHGCLSDVSVVCCQVEVSATGWSLVQRSPTECGESCVWSRNLKNEEALASIGRQCHGETEGCTSCYLCIDQKWPEDEAVTSDVNVSCKAEGYRLGLLNEGNVITLRATYTLMSATAQTACVPEGTFGNSHWRRCFTDTHFVTQDHSNSTTIDNVTLNRL
jgi:hypothetical protein